MYEYELKINIKEEDKLDKFIKLINEEELDDCSRIIRYISPENEAKILFDVIKDLTGYSKADLNSKSRKRELVRVRQCFLKILYEETKVRQEDVSKNVSRDHATVIHARKQIDNLMYLKDIKRTYIGIKKEFSKRIEEILSN